MDLSEITNVKSAAPLMQTISDGLGRFGRSVGEATGKGVAAAGSGLSSAKNFIGRNMEAGLNQQVSAFDPKTMALIGGGLGGLAGGLGGLAFGGKGKRLRSALLGLLAGGGVGAGAGAFAGQEMGRAAQRNVPDDIQANSWKGGTLPHMKRDAKASVKDIPGLMRQTFGGGPPGKQRAEMNRTINRNNPGIYDAHRSKASTVSDLVHLIKAGAVIPKVEGQALPMALAGLLAGGGVGAAGGAWAAEKGQRRRGALKGALVGSLAGGAGGFAGGAITEGAQRQGQQEGIQAIIRALQSRQPSMGSKLFDKLRFSINI